MEIKEIQVKRITMKYHLIKPKKMFLNFMMRFLLCKKLKIIFNNKFLQKIKNQTIQIYSKNFMEKIKNFMNVSYFKYKQNKNYFKLLQMKFIIKNYVSQCKQQKYLNHL